VAGPVQDGQRGHCWLAVLQLFGSPADSRPGTPCGRRCAADLSGIPVHPRMARRSSRRSLSAGVHAPCHALQSVCCEDCAHHGPIHDMRCPRPVRQRAPRRLDRSSGTSAPVVPPVERRYIARTVHCLRTLRKGRMVYAAVRALGGSVSHPVTQPVHGRAEACWAAGLCFHRRERLPMPQKRPPVLGYA
jgi:hypothetical protein